MFAPVCLLSFHCTTVLSETLLGPSSSPCHATWASKPGFRLFISGADQGAQDSEQWSLPPGTHCAGAQEATKPKMTKMPVPRETAQEF
jgi:hypothetical protein